MKGGTKPNLGRPCDVCGQLRTWNYAWQRDEAKASTIGNPHRHPSCCPQQSQIEKAAKKAKKAKKWSG